MLAVRTRTQLCTPARLHPVRPARCSVQVKAEGNGFEQQVQKLKDDLDLPFPLEYGYAGAAWGAPVRLLPTSFALHDAFGTSLQRTCSNATLL